MPKFPTKEAEIITLAQQIENGLKTNTNLAGSPVSDTTFTAMLAAFLAKRDEIVAKEASLGEDYDLKGDLMDDLTGAMQQVIDYTESISGNDPTELASIGWGVPGEATKQPPGQPRALEIINQSETSIFLDWKNPSDGGRVASYRVERRELPDGSFTTCGATNQTEIILTNQPRGKDLEYRVVAFNSNGDSTPGNTVSAVL
jgi:hypothetical protein